MRFIKRKNLNKIILFLNKHFGFFKKRASAIISNYNVITSLITSVKSMSELYNDMINNPYVINTVSKVDSNNFTMQELLETNKELSEYVCDVYCEYIDHYYTFDMDFNEVIEHDVMFEHISVTVDYDGDLYPYNFTLGINKGDTLKDVTEKLILILNDLERYEDSELYTEILK